MMLRQGLIVIGAGLMIGLVGAIASTRALESMLFGVEPTEPATWVTVAALFGSVALLAC
jgi:sensor histidine kinase regulating citrate/malate metabolism